VAAWLPGTEGQGVADVLCGTFPFTGRLAFDWPRSPADLPRTGASQAIWKIGDGLDTLNTASV
jgi:beta-glucosidase